MSKGIWYKKEHCRKEGVGWPLKHRRDRRKERVGVVGGQDEGGKERREGEEGRRGEKEGY